MKIATDDRAPTLAVPLGPRHALVCLDRSPTAEACIPYVQLVVETFGARVTLLHVMPSPAADPDWPRSDALAWELRRLQAESYLREQRSVVEHRYGAATSILLAQGAPAERIVATVRELGADLTILANHGERRVEGGPLGSTAQRVLSLAGGSVLLVQAGTPARMPPKRILVPLDGSPRAEAVSPTVVALAHRLHAEVVLVHAVSDPASTRMLAQRDDLSLAHRLAGRLEASATRYLEQLRQRVLRGVPSVRTKVVRRSDPHAAVLDLAGDADLIVLSAHGSTCNPTRPCGSVSTFVLANARVPVLVLSDVPGDASLSTSSPPPPRPSGTRFREGV